VLYAKKGSRFLPGVVCGIVFILLADCHIEQLFVAVQALRGRAAHDGSDGAPLCGHELGQVQQLFILFASPLRLFDARIQPLIPVEDRVRFRDR